MSPQTLFLHLDCKLYRGDRPCRMLRLCEGCSSYDPMGRRVLIIKLGALGDVVRTACLLPGLRETADPPHITWLTSKAAKPLVERMPGVDRVLEFNAETLAHLEMENFETIISLDKEPAPAAVAMRVTAGKKLGIGLSRYGTVYPLNDEAHYYFRLGLDNDEKFFGNKKSYPELIYDALGMAWRGQAYQIVPTEADRTNALGLFAEAGLEPGRKLIGINPGAGHVFAHKAWREDGWVEVIDQIGVRRPELAVALLGGPDEADLMNRIKAAAKTKVLLPGSHYSLGTFAALIERCAVVASGDTLAMHLALATGRRSVAIFGPTCQQEIEMYGRGVKITTPIGCAPCYRRGCDKTPNCQELIPAAQVLDAIVGMMKDEI
ncbi:glycosyltransferase family 9 protein [bacterium]|nr:glycosyltransferase family 9 protein [bacterium]